MYARRVGSTYKSEVGEPGARSRQVRSEPRESIVGRGIHDAQNQERAAGVVVGRDESTVIGQPVLD